MLTDNLRHALDPVSFAREGLGFTPDPWQQEALRWSGKRLLLNCCRQSGKSTTAAILGLHRALFWPGSLVLLVSPSLRQSSELFRKVSEGIEKLDLPPRKVEDNRLSVTFANNSRIVSLPSTESTIRGFSGANLIIEDEAARVPDELYIAVRPMLAVSGGRLILLSTPFGKRGHFFKEYTEEGRDWERIRIPATECPRITAEFLQEERASLGDWWFRQEYMCEFVETVDQVFTYELVMSTLSDEIKPLFGVVR
jgi:hypothetical protein